MKDKKASKRGTDTDTKRDRQTQTDRQTDRQTETQRENSNSKTLFSKDCSLGSFRPVYQLVLAKLPNM